nr:GNAT family N-acetyltransferase [uncultured Carboxylicivirga sp.]
MFRILRANQQDDYKEWIDIWTQWKGKEVFAHPDYLLLYKGYSEPMCALYSKGEQIVLFPFCLREVAQNVLSEKYYDIITPYGFGDIYLIGHGEDRVVLDEFDRVFQNWVRDNKIISEFIRFDAFSRSRNYYTGDLQYNNDIVACDLYKGESVLWDEFKPKVRRNIRKALSHNLTIEFDFEGIKLDSFVNVYYRTMQRLEAAPKYYMNRSYFEYINSHLKGNFIYVFVKKGDLDIAAELVLLSDEKMYYYLGGTLEDYFYMRPNELLKFEIMKWGINNNRRYYVLGGGYHQNDSLLKFKSDFAPSSIFSYKVGSRIFDSQVYKLLVDNKQKMMKNDKEDGGMSHFFPLYRGENKNILI